jgi:hypothetical protein
VKVARTSFKGAVLDVLRDFSPVQQEEEEEVEVQPLPMKQIPIKLDLNTLLGNGYQSEQNSVQEETVSVKTTTTNDIPRFEDWIFFEGLVGKYDWSFKLSDENSPLGQVRQLKAYENIAEMTDVHVQALSKKLLQHVNNSRFRGDLEGFVRQRFGKTQERYVASRRVMALVQSREFLCQLPSNFVSVLLSVEAHLNEDVQEDLYKYILRACKYLAVMDSKNERLPAVKPRAGMATTNEDWHPVRSHKTLDEVLADAGVKDALLHLANMSSPHEMYPLARSMDRTINMHTGPTNSGKTFKAIEALKTAKRGVYCAPLRLLAWEVHEKLCEAGVPCNLLTGQEKVIVPGANHSACTVEMASSVIYLFTL